MSKSNEKCMVPFVLLVLFYKICINTNRLLVFKKPNLSKNTELREYVKKITVTRGIKLRIERQYIFGEAK